MNLTLRFVGLGSSGQEGVYSCRSDPPSSSRPVKIADTNTPIPGGIGYFSNFTSLACGGSYGVSIAFAATGLNGQKGIYAIPVPDTTGVAPFPLTKIIDLNDILDGKTITDLQLGAGAMAGDLLAFKAIFADGSQGLYTIPMIDNLFISLINASGSGVALNVTAPAGYNYVAQSTTSLAIPAWGPEPSGSPPRQRRHDQHDQPVADKSEILPRP